MDNILPKLTRRIPETDGRTDQPENALYNERQRQYSFRMTVDKYHMTKLEELKLKCNLFTLT